MLEPESSDAGCVAATSDFAWAAIRSSDAAVPVTVPIAMAAPTATTAAIDRLYVLSSISACPNVKG